VVDAAGSAPVAVEAAPAKVNLYLHVVGRRADGYHLLDSLAVFAGPGDRISARPADALTLEIDGPFAPALAATPADDNLVLRAARALRRAGGGRAGAAIRLTKTLPVAAGIGGGSADAAAALRALVRLWDLRPAPEDLARLALTLGADVPVCLSSRAAFMGGIGDALAPAPALPAGHLLLVNPDVAVATKAVFAARVEPFSAPARFAEPPADAAALAALLAARRNDLEVPARRIAPEAATPGATLAGEPGCLLARMSGSGATWFGLFADERGARDAARRLLRAHPDWWIAASPLLNAPLDAPENSANRAPLNDFTTTRAAL